MKIFIPNYVKTVLDVLYKNGYEAYIVGGCVRDSLLNKEPQDYDICTNCLPDNMLEIFSDFSIIETGLKHGTVTVISDSHPLEITTYRSDGEYIGHRKPAQVKFETNLTEDLKRRDFTINALCYSEKTGIIDLFGGISDLENGIIKCVGEPSKRFDEDALRIMRGIRFASTLGFKIEEHTANAIHRQKALLNEISAERIASELKKLLCGDNVLEILTDYRDVIGTIIPEIIPCFDFPQNNPHHCYDVYTHICKSVSQIKNDWVLRLTMLLHDIGKPVMAKTDENGLSHFKKHQFVSAEMSKQITDRLKIDTKSRTRILNLIYEHDNRIEPTKKAVKKLMSKYDLSFMLDYVAVRHADTLAQSDYKRDEKLEELSEIQRLAIEAEQKNECFKITDLAVNGNDLISAGFRGKEIGLALNAVLDAVIDEQIQNNKKEIMDFLKEQNL